MRDAGWEPAGYQEQFPLWFLRGPLQSSSGKGQRNERGVSPCHMLQAGSIE